MATSGPNNGSTFSSDSTVGTIAIANPSNASSSNNSYATAVLLLNQVTNYLKVTNFGFSIPIHSTIDGILVEIERNSTVLNSITDNIVKLVLPSGIIDTTNKSSGAIWPNSDAYASFGSSSDNWGANLTPIDINDVNFGVVISGAATLLAGTAQIDHVRITISYTQLSMPHNMLKVARVGNNMSRSENIS